MAGFRCNGNPRGHSSATRSRQEIHERPATTVDANTYVEGQLGVRGAVLRARVDRGGVGLPRDFRQLPDASEAAHRPKFH